MHRIVKQEKRGLSMTLLELRQFIVLQITLRKIIETMFRRVVACVADKLNPRLYRGLVRLQARHVNDCNIFTQSR